MAFKISVYLLEAKEREYLPLLLPIPEKLFWPSFTPPAQGSISPLSMWLKPHEHECGYHSILGRWVFFVHPFPLRGSLKANPSFMPLYNVCLQNSIYYLLLYECIFFFNVNHCSSDLKQCLL